MIMGQFRFTTAGESHGKGLVTIVEGMVAGLPMKAEYINKELERRQAGYGRGLRMKIEKDKAEIISGVRCGLTMGSPIALLIPNLDWQNCQEIMSVTPVEKELESITQPRPGHADLAGVTKYNLKDIRPIMERASARETAARVAAGAIAKSFLQKFGIVIHSHTLAIGEHCLENDKTIDWEQVETSPVHCADVGVGRRKMAAIDKAKADGDTLGGVFELVAIGAPVGLGSHVSWDRRLDSRIAQAIMSINAIKGVEIGHGFALAKLKGSQVHDIIEPNPSFATAENEVTKKSLPWRRATNRAGGIEGGMSNGEEIIIRAAVKPIATLTNPLPSLDLSNGEVVTAHHERSDVCVLPAAGVIGEAMLAIVLADACLEKFGGDSLNETISNHNNYLRHIPSWQK